MTPIKLGSMWTFDRHHFIPLTLCPHIDVEGMPDAGYTRLDGWLDLWVVSIMAITIIRIATIRVLLHVWDDSLFVYGFGTGTLAPLSEKLDI